MSRDYKVYLEDILEAIGKIRVYTAGLSFSTFTADSKTLDAVVRNLEIIGEAVRGVPELVRSKHPEVDWKRITGLRNILIHEYFGVDAEIVWDIAQSKLDILESTARDMLHE
jgi:uncharacterized protein with HEPN domain